MTTKYQPDYRLNTVSASDHCLADVETRWLNTLTAHSMFVSLLGFYISEPVCNTTWTTTNTSNQTIKIASWNIGNGYKNTYMKKGHLNHLTQLLNLLLTSTNITICNIRLFFNLKHVHLHSQENCNQSDVSHKSTSTNYNHWTEYKKTGLQTFQHTYLHHCNRRINLRWKWNLDFVPHPINAAKQHYVLISKDDILVIHRHHNCTTSLTQSNYGNYTWTESRKHFLTRHLWKLWWLLCSLINVIDWDNLGSITADINKFWVVWGKVSGHDCSNSSEKVTWHRWAWPRPQMKWAFDVLKNLIYNRNRFQK